MKQIKAIVLISVAFFLPESLCMAVISYDTLMKGNTSASIFYVCMCALCLFAAYTAFDIFLESIKKEDYKYDVNVWFTDCGFKYNITKDSVKIAQSSSAYETYAEARGAAYLELSKIKELES